MSRRSSFSAGVTDLVGNEHGAALGSLVFLEEDADNPQEIRARQRREPVGPEAMYLSTFGFHKPIHFVLFFINP